MSQHSEFVRIWQAVKPPSPIGSSTSVTIHTRLFLKTFRGVRAISQFDQPFTPTHNSSGSFSTLISSVLQYLLRHLQPGHVQITRFRVYPHRLSPYSDSLSLRLFPYAELTLPVRYNSQAHYAKGTRSLSLPPLVDARFQVLFHSAIRGSFHLSLTVLVHYRSLSSIQPYQMVLADSHRISPVPRYSGYCQVL